MLLDPKFAKIVALMNSTQHAGEKQAAMGLLDFNADDIQGSVPALLSGMKTAFFASVAGVFAALTTPADRQSF